MDRKKPRIFNRAQTPDDAAENLDDREEFARRRRYEHYTSTKTLGENHPETKEAEAIHKRALENVASAQKTLNITNDKAERKTPMTHAKLAAEFEKQKKHEEALGGLEDAQEATRHHEKARGKLNVQVNSEHPLKKMERITEADKNLAAARRHENLMRSKVPEPSRNRHVLDTIYGKVGSPQRRGEHGGDWEYHANIADNNARKHRELHAKNAPVPHSFVTGPRGGMYYIAKRGSKIYAGHNH